MSAEASQQHVGRAIAGGVARSDRIDLRLFVIAAGIAWAILFVVVGLAYELQTYGDGATFSYAVAAEDAWAFHWHNIAGRFVVYLLSSVPGEIYVAATGDARGGIAVYGLLFFAAPLAGLLATFAADRSKGRVVSTFACGSTAGLCPLVFGFPTEMWVAHALFWPALALAHFARRDAAGSVLVFAFVIVATLLLRGRHDAAFLRAARALVVVVPIWAAVHALYPPDYYYASVFYRAAFHFFDPTILTQGVVRELVATLAAYVIAVLALRRLSPTYAPIAAAALVATALAVYWLRFADPLLAEDRYYMRTVLLIGTAAIGIVAAVVVIWTEGGFGERTVLSRALAALGGGAWAAALAGAIAIVMLIHAVESARFVDAFTRYRAAVRALAMGAETDRALGDPQFVSAARLPGTLDPLAWPSTTHFLSVLVAPDFAPRHLVVDPRANYFWISCRTATRNQETSRALPAHALLLVRLHACLHR
jgi:hypothetical protein